MPTSIERIAASFSPHEPLLTSLIDEDFQSQLPDLDSESLSVATFIRESQGCLAYSKQLLEAARNPTPRQLVRLTVGQSTIVQAPFSAVDSTCCRRECEEANGDRQGISA